MENGCPQRLTATDERAWGDHWYLRRTELCRYLGRYVPGKGLDYSATNRLILDFKMAVPRGGRLDLPVKEKAIAAVAAYRGTQGWTRRDGGDGDVKIVSVISYKGGVGKTTLAANLAAELAWRGKRILVMDMDA